jgi:hypothetical protein
MNRGHLTEPNSDAVILRIILTVRAARARGLSLNLERAVGATGGGAWALGD